MTVQIAKGEDLKANEVESKEFARPSFYFSIVLLEILNQLFQVENDRESLFAWMTEVSVHVFARQRATVIANDHAVRIEHRDDFENQLRAQFLNRDASNGERE